MFYSESLVSRVFEVFIRNATREIEEFRTMLNHFNFGSLCPSIEYFNMANSIVEAVEWNISEIGEKLKKDMIDDTEINIDIVREYMEWMNAFYKVQTDRISNFGVDDLNKAYMSMVVPFAEEQEETQFNFIEAVEVAEDPMTSHFVTWIDSSGVRRFKGFKTRVKAISYCLKVEGLGNDNIYDKHEWTRK